MPREGSFFPPASAEAASTDAAAPDALFDLAVNRAAVVAARVGSAGLGTWHARTRFARRVDLSAIEAALALKPAGHWHWNGGPEGGWLEGKAPVP